MPRRHDLRRISNRSKQKHEMRRGQEPRRVSFAPYESRDASCLPIRRKLLSKLVLRCSDMQGSSEIEFSFTATRSMGIQANFAD
jgi:hypothetical protein